MSAIIKVGSAQYTVEEGDRIRVARMKEEEGATVEIKDVLAVMAGSQASFGKPNVDGASVQAKVISHGRDKKIIVFKFRAKKRYRRTQGHRQDFTELEIEKIVAPGAGQPAAAKSDSEEAANGS